ncbi:MAG: regulator protein [Catenulispora sp.]|nr:regulator protein [Catenulispora sp.]
MQIRLLGPIRAFIGGAEDALGGTKQRTMLAALVLANGRPVSDDRLRRLLWDEEPPSTVEAQIHTYASRLRKRLGRQVPLTRLSSAYRIDLAEAWCDHAEFLRLAGAGRDALDRGEPARAAAILRRALDVWSGQALADATECLVRYEQQVWEERRLAALDCRIEAELALGLHHRLVAELTELVAGHPYRESYRAQLMVALSRSARQGDAVTLFFEGRKMLMTELGADPSPVLVRAYQEVLSG